MPGTEQIAGGLDGDVGGEGEEREADEPQRGPFPGAGQQVEELQHDDGAAEALDEGVPGRTR